MTLKERILNDYHGKPLKEFTVYQTNDIELSRMYDEVMEVIKNDKDFKRFLTFKGAITPDGLIRFDRVSDYIDPEDRRKNVQKIKVVFKYAIYTFFYNEIKSALVDIKEKENAIPLPEVNKN